MDWFAPQPRFRIYTRAGDYAHVLKDVVSGKATGGDDVEKLEHEVSAKLNVPYAICVPQARVGIYLAIKGLIKPGQKVVVSPYTIADVINMVIAAGGVPVFADIDRATTNISADEVEKLIDDQTGAVMVTHLHGIPCDIERIASICKSRNVPLIEDTAQAFGSRVGGKALGTFGDAGIFSFGMYKNVTSFYGGMVVSNNKALAGWIRNEMKDWPYQPVGHLLKKVRKALMTDISTWPLIFRSSVYWIFRFGYLNDVRAINKMVMVELDTSRKNEIPEAYLCKMLPLQARRVRRQIENIDSNSATRIRYSKLYYEGLKDLPELIIPPFKDDGSHIYNYFPIQYKDRQKLVKWLMRNRRDMAIQHLKNCAALPDFQAESRECRNADLTANQVILMPNYPSYGEDEVKKNIGVLREFFRHDRE